MSPSIHTTLTGILGGAAAGALTAVGAIHGFDTYGWMGGIGGGILGFIVGTLVGGSPWFIGSTRMQWHLNRTSTEKLKTELLDGKSYFPHIWIDELVKRGERVEQFWPYILSLLESNDSEERHQGRSNLSMWFPRLFKYVEGFDPDESTEVCREKLKGIEELRSVERYSSNIPLGLGGGIDGGALRLTLSILVGGLPWFCYWCWRIWRFKRSSTEVKLLELARESVVADWWVRELIDQGVPFEQIWPSFLAMLGSDSGKVRRSGWQCTNIWFPRMALQVADFDPRESAEACREIVRRFENVEPDAGALLLEDGAPDEG